MAQLSGLFTSSSSRRRVKLPVLVYVDGEVVGFGFLYYYDYYCDSVFRELTEYRCYAHNILVDTEEVGVFNMCFADMLSHTEPGIKQRTLHYNVYVDNVEVGHAKIRITDVAGKAYTYTELLSQSLKTASNTLYYTALTLLLYIARRLRNKTVVA